MDLRSVLTFTIVSLCLLSSITQSSTQPEAIVPLDGPVQKLPAYNKNANLDLTPQEESALGFVGSIIGLTLKDINAIIGIGRIGLGLLGALDKIFATVFNGTSFDFDFLGRPGADKELLAMYQIITHRLDQIENRMAGTEEGLQRLIRGLPTMIRWEIALDTLEEYTRPINSLYHRFAFYQKHRERVEDHTLRDFAETVVSHDAHSVQSLMANIHSMVAPNDPPVITGSFAEPQNDYNAYRYVSHNMYKKERLVMSRRTPSGGAPRKEMDELSLRPSVFVLLTDVIKNYDFCKLYQTPQQLVLGLYTLLAVTQARGFAMVNFSWMLLKFHEKGNFTLERDLASSLYFHYTRSMLREALAVVEDVPNYLRKCDPERGDHVEGETFEQLTELLQGYVENEVDMNPSGTCGHHCASYAHSPVFNCYMGEAQFCGKHRRCQGQVHDCKFFDSDSWICLSELREKRYDWIKFEDGRVFGKQTECNRVMKVDSWWRFLYHCSYCACQCDDPYSNTTDRYFSLLPVVSDVANNMVVTGLRFRKVGRVMHIQVQQGRAVSQGQVDPASRRWVELEDIDVEDPKRMEGIHFKTLLYQSRSFDLDRLLAPKGHVVTGVKFRLLGSHVNLEVWVTPINFTSGELSPRLSYWKSNDNTPVMRDNPRTEVILNDPGDPRDAYAQAMSTHPVDTFIKFRATSMWKDAAQLTVPFFDAQDVTTTPPSWLQGVELHHRSPRGFAGFIGFKIFNYNITRHFDGVLDGER